MNQKEMLSFFNFSCNPFRKDIPTQQLKLLPGIENALKLIRLLFESKGIGLLTSKSGCGKSCILRLSANSLNPGLFKPIYICHTSVGILEFYIHLCFALGLEVSNRRAPMFNAMKEHILALNKSSHIHPILFIDEADKLSNDILREIRLIANFEYDSFNAITILLCGNQSLVQRFGLSILEPLANSITFHIHLDTLTKPETFSYIEQRIKDVSNGHPVFTKNALSLIHQASGGVMRVINNLSYNSLFKAFLSKSPQVEKEHVQSVISR